MIFDGTFAEPMEYVDPAEGLELGHSYAYSVQSYREDANPQWREYSRAITVTYVGATSDFVLWLESAPCVEPYYFVAGNDPVPTVPPLVFGYRGTLPVGQDVKLQVVQDLPSLPGDPWRYGLAELDLTYVPGTDRYQATLPGDLNALRAHGGESFRVARKSGVVVLETWPPQAAGEFNEAFYRTALNNRVIHLGAPQYLMNPANQNWRNVFVAAALHYTGSNSCDPHEAYDGIMGDNPFAQIPIWQAAVLPSDYDYANYSTSYDANGTQLLLNQTRQAFYDAGRPDALFAINGFASQHLTLEIPGVGAVVTSGAVDGWSMLYGTAYTGTTWLRTLKSVLQAVQLPNGRSICLLSRALVNQPEFRLLDLAGYLLTRNVAGQPESWLTHMQVRGVLGGSYGMAAYAEQQLEMGMPRHSLNPGVLPLEPWDPDVPIEDPVKTPVNPAYRFQVRCFDNGLVMVDAGESQGSDPDIPTDVNIRQRIAAWDNPPYPETMYLVSVDETRLVDGGRLTTTPIDISTTILSPPNTAYILVKQPLASPSAEAHCVYPLFKDGTGPYLIAARITSSPAGQSVWAEIEDRGQGTRLFDGALQLFDDGITGGDATANDGVYTVALPSVPAGVAYGQRALHVFLQDENGLAAYTSVTVHVTQELATQFVNKTSDVGLTAQSNPGMPYALVALDYDNDGSQDVFVTKQDLVDNPAAILRNINPANAALPVFQGVTQALDGDYFDLRGASAADYDNDGDADPFAAGAAAARLFEWDQGAGRFVERGGALGLQAADANGVWTSASRCGAWGDYDRDGYVDLFVGRMGVQPFPGGRTSQFGRLFHNEGGSHFTLVSAAPFDTTIQTATKTMTATWTDVNEDGLLDLYVGNLACGNPIGEEPPPGTPSWNQLYVQLPGGGFENRYWQYFDYWYPWGLTSVQFTDLDNDGDLDFVFGGEYEWNGYAQWGGDDFVVASTLDRHEKSGALAFDFDLDGAQDLLYLTLHDSAPNTAGMPPQLFRNAMRDPGVGGVVFENVTTAVGLQAGAASGVLATAFNAPGAPDLFVGRPLSVPPPNAAFYQNLNKITGQDLPANHFVGIKLRGGGLGNNRSAIGAKVTVTAGALVQTRHVDGGSGRGGQQPSLLLVGLGGYTGPVTADVVWPNGFLQSGESLTLDGVTEIVDSTAAVQLVGSSVTGDAFPTASGTHWVFTWDTTNRTCPEKDEVTLNGLYASGDPCYQGGAPVVLKMGEPGVVVTQADKVGGGQAHTLEWDVAGCWPSCAASFTVASSTLSETQQSAPQGIVSSTAGPGIVASSVQGTVRPSIEDTYWVFTWGTANNTCGEDDEVEVTSSYVQGNSCWVGDNPIVLKRGFPGVLASIEAKEGGGYTHRLEWHNVGCAVNCSYNYKVRSSTLAATETSPSTGTKRLRTTVCVQ